ncbi:Ig-like domain-containing protein [Aestuariibacter sp. A3R04]|uniref:Ig-like domain-containing protein n=1 Tax=Aestuariibacter sp. A3R04 TaxID=2841571 RepID=UPI001C096FF5|nr:Ig-like domain-containing protein [Aestuariibacter sp. A3R04]MBU3021095.1 Ig-like domain-containing protein [Aestuariibacter sp. A3R04]
MKYNLLVNTLSLASVCVLLTACGGGSDDGYDPNFNSSDKLIIANDPVAATFDEESGVQRVDLLSGVTIGGEAAVSYDGVINIGQMEIVAQNNFVTPQAPSNTVANQTISPFRLSDDGRALLVDTDAFSNSLRQCDSTDNIGAEDADGNVIGDGNRDFPQSATFLVSYAIDHGYDYAPGVDAPGRTISITVNAKDDPVAEVVASDIEIPAGGQAQVVASTMPAFACDNSLVYTVADPSIATINEDGVISALSTGQTTFTAASVDNPEAKATAMITVTAAFSLVVSNDDKDNLGASLGTKAVPACVAAGVRVEPVVVNHTLNGSYTYDWTSSNDVDMPFIRSEADGFGATGVFQMPSEVGALTTVQVSLASGDTGATPLTDVAGKRIDLTTVANAMCSPGESAHAAGFNTDFNLDGAGAPYKGNATAVATGTSVSGSGSAVEVTAGTVLTEEGVPYSRVAQEVWNKQRNWYSATYGQGLASVGKTYQYAVWVKLNSVPAEPVTLTHTIVPWVYEGIPDGAAGYSGRITPGGGTTFSAELDASTDWQYIEFVNDETGERAWSVPDTWNQVTDVFTLWEIYGLPAGESLLIDDYSVVPVGE